MGYATIDLLGSYPGTLKKLLETRNELECIPGYKEREILLKKHYGVLVIYSYTLPPHMQAIWWEDYQLASKIRAHLRGSPIDDESLEDIRAKRRITDGIKRKFLKDQLAKYPVLEKRINDNKETDFWIFDRWRATYYLREDKGAI